MRISSGRRTIPTSSRTDCVQLCTPTLLVCRPALAAVSVAARARDVACKKRHMHANCASDAGAGLTDPRTRTYSD